MSPDAHATTPVGAAGDGPSVDAPDWDAIDYRIVPAIKHVRCPKLRARLAHFAKRWSPSADQKPDRKSMSAGKSD